jgi:hypothetical protein
MFVDFLYFLFKVVNIIFFNFNLFLFLRNFSLLLYLIEIYYYNLFIANYIEINLIYISFI